MSDYKAVYVVRKTYTVAEYEQLGITWQNGFPESPRYGYGKKKPKLYADMWSDEPGFIPFYIKEGGLEHLGAFRVPDEARHIFRVIADPAGMKQAIENGKKLYYHFKSL